MGKRYNGDVDTFSFGAVLAYEVDGYGGFGEVAGYPAASKCTRGSPDHKYVAKGWFTELNFPTDRCIGCGGKVQRFALAAGAART